MATEARPAVERQLPPKGLFTVANALVRALAGSPLHPVLGGRIGLLSFTGRKSGRQLRIPVGIHEVDGQLLTLTSSPWRFNFRGGAPVTLRRSGRDLRLTATLVDDPEQVADVYERLIERFGYGKAARRMGVRINVDRAPSREELIDASRRSGLSVVTYAGRPPAASGPGTPAN